MRLSELIHGLPVVALKGDMGIEVKGITKDSRKVKEGYIFFSTDKSEKYIEDASEKGAVAVVADREPSRLFQCSVVVKDPRENLGQVASRFYGLPSEKLTTIGITGTNGKTTTSYLIESILKSSDRKAGLIGTISYRYDGRTIKAENTTPGAEELHGLLHDMCAANMEFVVMEVSSHALDQKRVEGINFDTAILTNLTHDHLDYHGDFEHYKEAKRLFFKHYLPQSMKDDKYAILNMDDPYMGEFVPDVPVKTLYYSLSKNTDAYLSGYREDINGLRLECSLMGEKFSITSPMIGVFNASNILAASLFGYTAKIPRENIVAGIEALGGVPGRLERVKNTKGISVFIDYAHTPDALKKVLEMLCRLKLGKLIVVFGCGGDRDTAKRPIMGNIASRLADFSIITTDNPRSEDPAGIIGAITKGFEGNFYKVVENRKDAIFEGLRMSKDNDVLLIAGKGHEDYQIVGHEVFHFSDREVVEEFFNVAH
jgi:UDP-N-acetylmuramoyl-L-alanyl-D-glutamate--2,6-diaminopimelate ligase